jgi:hypothetical protein
MIMYLGSYNVICPSIMHVLYFHLANVFPLLCSSIMQILNLMNDRLYYRKIHAIQFVRKKGKWHACICVFHKKEMEIGCNFNHM